MTKLLWDQTGQRFYETGIDRGVLYLADGSGVPWSGLTGVDEDFGGDSSTPYYFDGIKNLDAQSFGDFAGTLTAFTYPDEFLEYEGVESLGNGLYIDDQNMKMFGLSYRTLIGNDVDGTGHAYKVHILYNLTATPSSMSRDTLSSSPSAQEFSWSLASIPADVTGYRPTAHVILDSRKLTTAQLQAAEGTLYGDTSGNAHLPTIDELITLIRNA